MAKKKDNTMMVVVIAAAAAAIYYFTRGLPTVPPVPTTSGNLNEFLETNPTTVNTSPLPQSSVSSIISSLANASPAQAPLVPIENVQAPLPSQAVINQMSPAEQQELLNSTTNFV